MASSVGCGGACSGGGGGGGWVFKSTHNPRLAYGTGSDRERASLSRKSQVVTSSSQIASSSSQIPAGAPTKYCAREYCSLQVI